MSAKQTTAVANDAPRPGFDVTVEHVIGRVIFDETADTSEFLAACIIIDKQRAPGKYRFPSLFGGDVIIDIQEGA